MAISIIDINVKNLIPNPNNPRRDVGDVTELADSIKEQGLQQALADLGYPTSDEENKALNGCFLPEDDEAE